MATLYIAHDPMCSWCWGFRPARNALILLCQDAGIEVVEVLGGLAADNDNPMSAAMIDKLKNTWQQIQQHIPGTVFNFDYWDLNQPRRSTYRACRAVIVAQTQSQDAGVTAAMTYAIQEAYYLKAKNPSDRDTLIDCARGVGLQIDAFADQLDSQQTKQAHQSQMQLCGSLGLQSYPSLAYANDQQVRAIAIDYLDAKRMFDTLRE